MQLAAVKQVITVYMGTQSKVCHRQLDLIEFLKTFRLSSKKLLQFEEASWMRGKTSVHFEICLQT